MRLVLIFIVVLFSSSCAIVKRDYKKKDWVNTFKRIVVISSVKSFQMRLANPPPQLDYDLSESINYDLMGSTIYYKIADSLGKKFFASIVPSQILDYQGRKAVLNESLMYYTSPRLDSLANAYYKDYKRRHILSLKSSNLSER